MNISMPDINTDWDITMKPGEYIHTILTRDEEKERNLLAARETTQQMKKKQEENRLLAGRTILAADRVMSKWTAEETASLELCLNGK